jgi:hypothetical protein
MLFELFDRHHFNIIPLKHFTSLVTLLLILSFLFFFVCCDQISDLSKARECFLACVRQGRADDWQMLVQIELELVARNREQEQRQFAESIQAVATLRKHLKMHDWDSKSVSDIDTQVVDVDEDVADSELQSDSQLFKKTNASNSTTSSTVKSSNPANFHKSPQMNEYTAANDNLSSFAGLEGEAV